MPDPVTSWQWQLTTPVNQSVDVEMFDIDLVPFGDAGKAVMEVEYRLPAGQFCPGANAMNFNALKKKPSLNAWRVACR